MTSELERKLGYQFTHPTLLDLALTHRSYAEKNNERLEFLGDAIVNCVIGEMLFQRFVEAQEGDLSRWRATLVNRDTLGNLARCFELGRFTRLGPGELKSGGALRQSILSCTMEAVIGAIYLDSHFESVYACLAKWYEPLLQSLTLTSNHKDPKTLLQEYLQSKHLPLPVYVVESVTGEAHQQIFSVSCIVENMSQKGFGKGTSRRKAEQDAAEAILGILKK